MTLELRNTPVQARSAARLTGIEQAAETAIATIGIDKFTTADVARIAGCSIGTVYRYFPDRVAILDRLRPNRHEYRRIAESLLAVATGRQEHEYLGLCPDGVEGPDSRDPDCKACQVLVEAEQAVAG
ncbi:TetR/AcrR family transcriptional regulator [Curtobacterium flaccumfaciens]|uniref:TetR/AcrR family transcriptional regulator n=1 Tax=Curtobacterium flaccumfaciens TaxID=2035 RepID=UPI00188AE39C|nr:TetR/AcrR family transcriptional regulator [Curtobacterium flaccumfaciens]MBF4628914.1 helix-turn-helix transcriptional regulator [Curtobacterium flaccumfaciens]